MEKNIEKNNSNKVQLVYPNSSDGYSVNNLVDNCPPLDPNSLYCNILQCYHFAATSVCAKQDDILIGFISGYLIPDSPNTLFIWQVAVAESGRGKGLATKMLLELLSRPACVDVNFLETTITPSNEPSKNLFNKLSHILDTNITKTVAFDRHQHFNGLHESEDLYRIGPLKTNKINNGNI